ncbi:MAG TPA: hypothetical protein VFQ45_03205 [Longimicrobium sp.]|nr:hypothetical protein [Longimicrobium sp.]
MAKLKIDFNCMCLFVTNGEPGKVRVLMPATACPHHPELRHTVRLMYRDRNDEVQYKDMEGWSLELRRGLGARGAAPPSATAIEGTKEIVNLTSLTGGRVDSKLLTGSGEGKIASRVSIEGATVEDVACQDHRWRLGAHDGFMAHQVTWCVDDVEMYWKPLGAKRKKPLAFLEDVKPETQDGDVYRVYVYHVLEQDLPADLPPPPGEETLVEDDIASHFPMYYPLLTGLRVDGGFVPERVDENGTKMDGGSGPSGTFQCKLAQAMTM